MNLNSLKENKEEIISHHLAKKANSNDNKNTSSNKSPKGKSHSINSNNGEMTYEMLRDFIIDSKITSDTNSEPVDPMEDPKMK